MEIKALGALVTPQDYRRNIVTAATFAVSPAIPFVLPQKLHTDLGNVLDQNKEPACVAHDIIYLMRRYWFNKTGAWIDFSPRFLDILVKRIDQQDREVGGTYPGYVLKLAATVGCCTTKLLPNDTTLPILQYRDDSVITPEMMAEAEQYKIPGYISIPLDFASTRNAIYLYEALTCLFLIGQEFWVPSWLPADIDPVKPPAKIESGHQLAATGWDSPVLNLGRNQWGPEWDMGGDFHYDPKKWAPFIAEQWAIAEVPKDIAAFLKLLPSPASFHYHWDTNLARGAYSVDIQMVQVAYMILGYLQPLTPEEFGWFGPKLAAANFAFQCDNKIPPSANDIGPKTRAALNKKFPIVNII